MARLTPEDASTEPVPAPPVPVITALKDDAADIQNRGRMERTFSTDIREEKEDLKEAAEQSSNVILDLALDGTIRWVSASWQEIVGTEPVSVKGKLISDLLVDDKDIFTNAVESMKKDDSKSHLVRFSVQIGELSRFANEVTSSPVDAQESEISGEDAAPETQIIMLEGQGIMVYDRGSVGDSHSMWMIHPYVPREIKIDLPQVLIESLGFGAEVLATYLTTLAEHGVNDPQNHPPPMPVLCRICERQIPPWWFEKHTELCLQEHRAEMDISNAQDGLTEHRNAIVKVLDAFEARNSRPTSIDATPASIIQPEYKGLPIGPASNPSTGPSSNSASPSGSPFNRSRESSSSGLGHVRQKSFAVRRPLTRIVELLCDLCDTAIEINTPAIKDAPDNESGEFRTQSPLSESRVSQVLQWQSPSTNTLENEQGLAALCADTENAARAKVEAVLRHRRIIEYSERIRCEFAVLVQDCIDEAIRKAERIAAGELSSSEDEEMVDAQEEQEVDDQMADPVPSSEQIQRRDDSPHNTYDPPASLVSALRKVSDTSLSRFDRRQSSATASTRSNSPRECPTPRSHRGAISILGQSQHYKRSSMHFESDAGDSDSSLPSSLVTGLRRTESPSSELALSRAASSRERHRRSLILPGAASPRRQISPGRSNGPPSPLRISKPRFPNIQQDAGPSPIVSPQLSGHEFGSTSIHSHHHRRQSSATSSDWRLHHPPSPRLAAASHPQAKAVQTSIKDFDIIKPISKGAFGSVYLSKKKSTGDYYAIKVLKKADMVSKNQVTNVKAERAIMMWQGQSDFVAKLYWTFSSKDNLYLVMEYLNGGDCASLIKVLGGLQEDWARKYLAEVVLGVEHLHDRGIVHRDLKPDNLLIDQKGHLKLTDFGLSRMGLIGRQKRALNNEQEPPPDLLKSNHFRRSISLASSRSASFDFHGNNSPGSTPLMTPSLAGDIGQPSYFSLNSEAALSREPSRRTSGHRSDSGGSESLSAMFTSFSLNEPASAHPSRRSMHEDSNLSEYGTSPELHPLRPITSNSQHTPPLNTMMPPAMALFDPEDSTRRFVGTPDYLAPETINGTGQDETSDWWSLGCILFEFLFGYPPFNADSPDAVFDNILNRRIHWPDDDDVPVSPEVKDLINRLIAINPRERLGANADDKFASGGEEIRGHPWFSGVNWETLLEDEAQFVPAPENPEDTEYFDSRGATLQSFAEEIEDQLSPAAPLTSSTSDYPDRPHDALSRVRTQVNNSVKRNLMPLHIPAHVRDGRNRRLSEPVSGDDFGNFSFKNLPVLEKANKDVIQKLRAEALQAQSKNHSAVASPSSPAGGGPSLESSPIFPPLKRNVSLSKPNIHPSSPSSVNQPNSSPSRPSQPSSPLLMHANTGPNAEKRKTSSGSSSLSHISSNSLQPGSFFDVPRAPLHIKTMSNASSPVKTIKSPSLIPPSPQKLSVGRAASGSRTRSQTVGSQDGELPIKDIFAAKRRSGIFDMSPSSSDNEDARANALLRVQRRRQSARRMSQINFTDGPIFRPLDVLICEDHPVSQMVMDKLLEKLRCRTIIAHDGTEAMRYAMSEVKFDIILMEIKLPQINGIDVARMVRDTKNANSQTPLVAVTGYLKELQDPHNFDELMEKPATTSKLISVLGKFCQWKPPSSSVPAPQLSTMPPSGLRQESIRSDDSPISVSSGYTRPTGSSFRGSSREDSISSSFFGDAESVANDDVNVVISRHPGDEWPNGGLGISEDRPPEFKHMPRLIAQSSAPPTMASQSIRSKSADRLKVRQHNLETKRQDLADMGDDEDEELGDVQVRAKSPQRKANRGSKLGTEMMRTNSRGSVISASEINMLDAEPKLPPPIIEAPAAEIDKHAPLTPPEIFAKAPGQATVEIDMDPTPVAASHPTASIDDATPTPSTRFSSIDQSTPRPIYNPTLPKFD